MCLSLLLPSLCVVSVISLVSVTNCALIDRYCWHGFHLPLSIACHLCMYVECITHRTVLYLYGSTLSQMSVLLNTTKWTMPMGVTITHTERRRSAIAAGFKTKSPKCLPQLCRHLLQKDQTSSLNNVKHSFLQTISRQSFGAQQSSKLSLVLARQGNFLNHSDRLLHNFCFSFFFYI